MRWRGWDNREKIAALKHELQERERELQAVRAAIAANEENKGQWEKRQQGLRDLLGFESYAELNSRADEQQIAALQAQQRELEQSADHLQQLQRQLNELSSQVKAKETTLAQLQALIGTCESDLRRFQQQRAACAAQAIELKPAVQPLIARIEADLKGKPLTLDTIDEQQSQAERFYNNSAKTLSANLGKLESGVVAQVERSQLPTHPRLDRAVRKRAALDG